MPAPAIELPKGLPPLCCAHCAAPLELTAKDGLRCSACPQAYTTTDGMLDLRRWRERALAPDPLEPGDAAAAIAAGRSDLVFKGVLEELLLALPELRSNRLDLLMRECRGAWLPWAKARGGRALFLGNALSGTVASLARVGFQTIVMEPSPERLALAQLRNEWVVPGRVLPILGGDGERLPFAPGCFDLVVQEEGLPETLERGYTLAECRRVCKGELALVAENRFGYKRSSGEKSEFRIPGPLEYLRVALRPARGVKSLWGYKRALRAKGWAEPRALALYPHQRDFAFVASLTRDGPQLAIGPKERANALKLLARRAGAFPLFTPSFLLCAARAELAREPERLVRVLQELARITREPCPDVEQIVATRGNTALVQTALPDCGDDDPRGRWTLHVTVSPLQEPQARNHYGRLQSLRARFPAFPVPEPLHMGEFEGLFLTCERRLPGLSAPQYTGNHDVARVMYTESARNFAALIVEPARAIDEALFEELIGAKFDLVARYASVASTLDWLARMRIRARELFLGLAIPRVVYHADLRSKHVQVDAQGHVHGYMDFGSSEASDLPYFDLLHLVAHERKQEAGLSTGRAWQIMRERTGLRDFERAALEDYRERLALPDAYCRAIEEIYPVLVTAMAEKNWEYSRPRWMHRAFGI